jgi:spore coat protein U-like protein
MKKYFIGTTLLCLLLNALGVAQAATASTSIPVSASVTQTCSISTTSALAFASYDPIGTNAIAPLNTTGQISISCAKGSTGLTIGMDNGTHVAGTQRQMIGGTSANVLSYSIFQPPSNAPNTACTFPGTTPWTNVGAGLLTLTSAPAKTARLYNVCGTVPGGQDVAADAYTDIVIATINF